MKQLHIVLADENCIASTCPYLFIIVIVWIQIMKLYLVIWLLQGQVRWDTEKI